MYQIYYAGELIFDPRGMNNAEPGDMRLAAQAGRLHLAVGSAGALTFTLPMENPAVDTIEEMAGTVKVVETISGDTVFLGRVTTQTLNLDGSHTYEAEGMLATLNDTVLGPYRFPDNYTSDSAYQTAAASGNVVAYWLGKLLETHNAMCGDTSHQIQLGTVTVRDPQNAIARSSDDWQSLWSVINGDLPESELGGYLNVRYAGDTIYLDYLAAFTEINEQTVSFAENLVDLARTRDYLGMFNGIIPIGKDGLTCAAAPNGSYGSSGQYYKQAYYVITPAQRSIYGNILRVVKWDGVETAAELVTRAVEYMDAATLIDSMKITAADLSGIDPNTARFALAKLLQILSPPHGIREYYAVVELVIDLLDQVSTQITLGQRGVTLTGSGGSRSSTSGSGGGSIVAGVTGVKGNAESTYRTGDVNLTPANIGAVARSGGTMTGPLHIAADGSQDAALLQETSDGRGNLQLYHADGSSAVNLFASNYGAELDLRSADGSANRATLFVASSGNGALRLYNNDGSYTNLNKDKIDAHDAAAVAEAITYTTQSVSGVTVSLVNAYRRGKIALLNLEFAMTAALSNWTTILTGLPAAAADWYDIADTSAASYTRPPRVRVTVAGELQIRYGAASTFDIVVIYPIA